VTLDIAGRSYAITCRDGEEEHLTGLGRLVDAKARDADRAIGNMTENRHLLVTALLLADALNEQQKAKMGVPLSEKDDEEAAVRVEQLAARMEKLATALETGGVNA